MTIQNLRYFPDEIWNRLPAHDFRARFFVETYTEKLRFYTPHFYQARLTNVFSNLREMLAYLAEFESTTKIGAYVSELVGEVEDNWQSDTVAGHLLSDLVELRKGIFGSIVHGLTVANAARLRAFCRAVLARESAYAARLVAELEDAIFGDHDLAKKRRLLSAIYDLTGLYVTHLLSKGHSPTYLFNRAQMFTRDNKYSGRSFQEQFKWVTEKLGTHKPSFEVFFAVHTNRPNSLTNISDEPEFAFSPTAPTGASNTDLQKLRLGIDPNLYVSVSLQSTDQVTAALRGKEKLDKLLDVVTALELTPQMKTSGHCLVRFQAGNATHDAIVSVDTLLAFMSSEVGTYFTHSESSIRQTFRGLEPIAKEQLGRSLRYLRLARDSVSIEQKILNLWIALESLFEKRTKATLPSILQVVPSLYAVAGIRRRVRYLRDLLVANQVAIPVGCKGLCEGESFGDHTSEEEIFDLLRNEAAATALFASLGSREHLKFKLLTIFEELRDNISISVRLQRSTKDVTRQLRRIYFIRNKMAHAGHHHGVRPQLATHLLDYIAICYKALALSASCVKDDSVYSISELLLASKMGAELVFANARSDAKPISEMRALLLFPVI